MEQKLLFLINREWVSPALDLWMGIMSSLDVWRIPLLIVALLTLVLGRFRARTLLLCLALSVGICDGVVAATLKQIVGRPRPADTIWDVRVVKMAKTSPRIAAVFQPVKTSLSSPVVAPGPGRSFPSGHTMNNFCAATLIALFYRRWGWIAFLPAGMVGWSRVYVGSHWPTDVLISTLLGTGLALLLLPLYQWGWRRLGPRFLPGLHSRHPSLVP